MAAHNSSSRMSRLAIFTSRAAHPKPGPSSPLSRELDSQDDDDWYIPYNGPIEQSPKAPTPKEDRDSWGELLNGWLSDDEVKGAQRDTTRVSHPASAPGERTRSRVVSGISRQTRSTGGRTTQTPPGAKPRASTMPHPRSEQAGGVGESPMPVERTLPPVPSPATTSEHHHSQPSMSKRASLASIFTFGRKSLRLSVSMDNLSLPFRRDRSNTSATPPPPSVSRTNSRGRPRANTTLAHPERVSEADEYYQSYYSTLITTPGNELGQSGDDSALRPHPYAYPFPEANQPEAREDAPPTDKGKSRLLNAPKISFNMLDPRGASKGVPAYLKPSPRNSVLKASTSTPNLRNIPKGKQRWWSAETWCDAILLPRPRFAMRFVDPSGSGRIVSPPPSPIMSPVDSPPISPRKPKTSSPKLPKKVRSMGNLLSPSPEIQVVDRQETSPEVMEAANRRTSRPKSFALDDLALPSPVPSLAKVLEDGRELDEQRKHWQSQASRSFLDKRAGAMSRARSKSIGAGQTSSRGWAKPPPESTFDFLAERTLLGNQMRPPTIHVRGPSVSKSRERSQSQTQTQTQSGTAGAVQSTVSAMFSRTGSKAHSHGHSNSLGNSISWKSSTQESAGGHSRNQSIGKQAFKLVVSTAAGAAAFCGLSSPTSDRGSLLPVDEKSTVQSPQRDHDHLAESTRFVETSDGGNVIVISPTSPSAALAMIGGGGLHSVSPTPSGLSGSAEGIGIAITLPSDDHSRQQGREPIRLPAHPYAQGYGYSSTQGVVETHDNVVVTDTSMGDEDAANQHRQPVLVHPYSHAGHPYAPHNLSPDDATNRSHLNIAIPSKFNTSSKDTHMYAELSPGHIREFAPEDIRYSPNMLDPPVVVTSKTSSSSLTSPKHPYVVASKRTSELGFGEALMDTMRRASVDSGLGTSESGGFARGIDWARLTTDLTADNARDNESPTRRVAGPVESVRSASGEPPTFILEESNEYLHEEPSPLPMDHRTPPFRRTTSGLSNGRLSSKSPHGNSSGSSPGMISHESSPPLSPRPINTEEDLDRFRDLFYRPSSSSISEDVGRASRISRRPSDTGVPVDISSARSALTRSGLSELARQLSEDLQELRRERGSGVSETDSQMWGRRHGGLRGSRPDDMEDPNVVLAHLTGNSAGAYHSPLRLPIDTSFINPTTNIPEDIESSRASSILELVSIPEDVNELVRMGEVGVVSTPSAVTSPHRFSTELSFVDQEQDETQDVTIGPIPRPPRVLSQQSSLPTPHTANTRSSYMTTGTDVSRMSGLSDFPAPPTQITPFNRSTHNLAVPRLVRELSHDTFGRQADDDYSIVGQAL